MVDELKLVSVLPVTRLLIVLPEFPTVVANSKNTDLYKYMERDISIMIPDPQIKTSRMLECLLWIRDQ